jgi:hypothetical protein
MPPDRFDLYAVIDTLRDAAWRIAAGAVVVGILAAAATYVLLPRVAEGMFGLGAIVNRDPVIPQQAPPRWPRQLQYGKGLSLPELKVEYPRLDGDGFRKYLESRKVARDATLDRVIKRLANAETRPEIINPQYGSTRADLRELGETAKPQENTALAMRIHVASRDGDAAVRAVTLLGEFIGQTVFDSQAQGLLARRLEQHDSQRLAYENDSLKHRFDIATTSEKVTRLRALQREFPETGGTPRQVVSVADGGSRYLTPTAQVVGLEATVADLRAQISTSERSRRKAELLAAYYRKAQAALDESGESRAALKSLDGLIARTFGDAKDDEVVREAKNDAALDLYALQTLREQGLRFVSGPTPPWRDESRVWKHGLAGALAGALLVVAVALLGHVLALRPRAS